MSARLEARIEAALDVADRLRSSGAMFDAEQINALCRSARASAKLNAVLHGDAMQLRRETQRRIA